MNDLTEAAQTILFRLREHKEQVAGLAKELRRMTKDLVKRSIVQLNRYERDILKELNHYVTCWNSLYPCNVFDGFKIASIDDDGNGVAEIWWEDREGDKFNWSVPFSLVDNNTCIFEAKKKLKVHWIAMSEERVNKKEAEELAQLKRLQEKYGK